MPETPADLSTPSVSFPRQNARTQRFTLGAPRSFALSPDGRRVAFVRSRSGTDRAGCLWVVDVPAPDAAGVATERLVADPAVLLAAGSEQLSAQERARRERTREGAAGIVGFATDRQVRRAAFALSSRLFVADLVPADDQEDGAPAAVRELASAVPVLDPRPDPTGTRVAYVAEGALRVIESDGTGDRALLSPHPAGGAEPGDVTWGLAEFVAAEEMGRHRGFWWSPDGDRLLASGVDVSPVQRWHLGDPADPAAAPVEVAYPAAGTPNADVCLALVSVDGERVDVRWDRDGFPYLAAVHWSRHGDPLLLVQARDQRSALVLRLDPDTGATETVREDTDPAWLEIVPGVPAWLPDGRLVTTRDAEGARRLVLGDALATPPSLQVDSVLDVDESGVLVAGTEEPTEMHLWRVGLDGTLEQLTRAAGVHSGRTAGGLVLVRSTCLDSFGAQVRLLRDGEQVAEVASYAETPVLTPSVGLLRGGARSLRMAVLLPTGWEPGSGPLPVVMDPYGGPHHLQVVAARNAFLPSQWLADQGFAVVLADGRGTPGRGPEWERAVAFDLAGPVLEDQVDALHAAAEQVPDLDLARVGIRGWSFGGYLAALAVLRRPDVFSAAVAGAPVTDWTLYDTHYTERYLGTPQQHPQAYERSSLLGEAAKLERPLLLIHGLADDNVVAAHTLRLSSALLAAGRPHTVLPLSGVTHMTPQEVVAENLLLLQVAFLRDALGHA